MPLPFDGQDLHAYILALRATGEEENLAHAERVIAMFSPPGKLRAFRELCLAIPLVPAGRDWRLKYPQDQARILTAAGASAGAHPAFLENLLAQAAQNLPRQPFLPAAMPEGGVWILLYDSTQLSGEPTPHVQSHPAFYMGNTSPDMLGLLARMGQGKQDSQDPVERFYFHQLRHQR